MRRKGTRARRESILVAGLVAIGLGSPAAGQSFLYTAQTRAPALETGTVSAGGLDWACEGSACTISGPWPVPGVNACAALAARVGHIVAYGYPGRRLDSAALAQCNRNARTQPVRPLLQNAPVSRLSTSPQVLTLPEGGLQPSGQPSLQAADSIEYSAPAVTRQTIAVEPPPTERLWAVQSGGGDGDFNGNGPRVQITTAIYQREHCLHALVSLSARELGGDGTQGALSEDIRIWCNPDNLPIERIVDEVRASASYTDTDWEIDTVVPGVGEVDPRRPMPEASGPVRAYMVIGDTNGDIFNNNNDGRDVGGLGDDGQPEIRRTSVQIQFNPIRVIVPIPPAPTTPSGPPGAHIVVVPQQRTPFQVLNHTRGDTEFFGRGPHMQVGSELSLSSDRRWITARVDAVATETGGDRTQAEGVFDDIRIWQAPAGWQIQDVQVYRAWRDDADTFHDGRQSVLDRRVGSEFNDADHWDDFLLEGVGEARRDPDAGLYFHPEDRWVRNARLSSVEAFRVVGDTDGAEAGSRTGVQVFYAPLEVTLVPVSPAAEISDFAPTVLLDVPTGDYANRLSGGNSCGPQAASRVLRFYGVSTTYEQFKRRVQSSGNLISDQSLGTPPGTLRDRMNDLAPGFVHETLGLGSRAHNSRALARLRELLDSGRPVIVLTGWSGLHAAGVHSTHSAAAMLHWVVVRGYDSRNGTFHIIDNGHAEEWSYDYLASLMDYGQDFHFEAALAALNIQKGSIIYRR